MNTKLVRKILAVTMTATMLIMPLTVGATDSASAPSGSTSAGSSSKATTVSATEASKASSSKDSSSSNDSSSNEETSTAQVATTSQVAVGGAVVKNELPGAFFVAPASPIAGIAIREGVGAIKSKAGFAGNETPFVRAYTVERKSSPAVYASFDAAAATVGGTVVGGINVDLGKLTGGKFTSLPEGVTVPVTIGIKNFDPNKTYFIVRVAPGGAIQIIPVTVENGRATFEITGGLAGYGLLVK